MDPLAVESAALAVAWAESVEASVEWGEASAEPEEAVWALRGN